MDENIEVTTEEETTTPSEPVDDSSDGQGETNPPEEQTEPEAV